MQNPWTNLPEEAPFVLPAERATIEQYNQTATREHRVHTQCMPEPYIGDLRTARLVLLLANPGYAKSDEVRFSKESNLKIWRANLLHEDHGFYPLFPIDPRLASETHPWFGQKLRSVISEFSQEHVGRCVASAELYPYHTSAFSGKLNSIADAYTAHLVRGCLARKAVFIVRTRREWVRRIPELAGYPLAFERKSRQNAAVSPGNLRPEAWQHVLSAMERDE